jgi:hypothetical protein
MKKRKAFKKPLAEEFKELYEEFLQKGFTTDQAFQLLLAEVKRKKK